MNRRRFILGGGAMNRTDTVRRAIRRGIVSV